ncbi:MAG: hypothetical protein OXQ29_17075 [Rhodospirillaceae bacterium]|nr:hypothetical protein [Rhodospirillaceae bacterium]
MSAKRGGATIDVDRRLTDYLDKIVSRGSRDYETIIGWPEEARYPLNKESGERGQRYAAVAAWLEFGVDMPGAAKIPPRPFIAQALEDSYVDVLDLLGDVADEGGFSLTMMKRLGVLVESAIKEAMVSGTYAPLSEFTLEKRQGRGGTRPLINTGALRQSVTSWAYAV